MVEPYKEEWYAIDKSKLELDQEFRVSKWDTELNKQSAIVPIDLVEWYRAELQRGMADWEKWYWRKFVLGEGKGEPRGILNDSDWHWVTSRDGEYWSRPPSTRWYHNGKSSWQRSVDEFSKLIRDGRVEWTPAPTSPGKFLVDIPRPVYRWSGGMELCYDGCHGTIFADLLVENARASVR